jgi:uncharacterized protein (DUF2235 family)
MANIIVCCDGTWNTLEERDGGLPCPTNVAKIYNAVADNDAQGNTQKNITILALERKEAF